MRWRTPNDDLSGLHLVHGDRECQKHVSDESEALKQECTQIIEKAQSLVVAAANNYRDRQGTQQTNPDQRNNTARENTDEDNRNESIEGKSSLQLSTGNKEATNANSAPVKPSDGSKGVPIKSKLNR